MSVDDSMEKSDITDTVGLDFLSNKDEGKNMPVKAGISEVAPSNDQIDYYRKYIKPKLYQVVVMVTDKCSEKAILRFLGISKDVFDLYIKWFPDFRNAITQGKMALIKKANDAIYKAAFGMKYREREITEIFVADENADGGMRVTGKKVKTTEKVIPPNIKALELVLTNHDPENWKKSVPINFGQQNNVTIVDPNNNDFKNVLDRLKSFSNETIIDAEVIEDGSSIQQ